MANVRVVRVGLSLMAVLYIRIETAVDELGL